MNVIIIATTMFRLGFMEASDRAGQIQDSRQSRTRLLFSETLLKFELPSSMARVYLCSEILRSIPGR